MKKILKITFILIIIPLTILTLNVCRSKKPLQNQKEKNNRLQLLGDLLNQIIPINTPELKLELPSNITVLRELEPLNPRDQDYSEKLITYQRAIHYFYKKKPDELIRVIRSFKNWQDTDYRFLLSAYLMKEDYQKAIDAQKHIKKISAQDNFVLGFCYLKVSELDKAEHCFNSLKKDSEFGYIAENQLANIYFFKADKIKGDSLALKRKSLIKKAINLWKEIYKSKNEVDNNIAYALGVSSYLIKDYGQARKYFLKIYEDSENFINSRIYLLLTLRDQKKLVELENVLDEIKWKIDQKDEESKNLRKTLIISYYFLGEDQYLQGNIQKAKLYWNKAKNCLYSYDIEQGENVKFLYIIACLDMLIDELNYSETNNQDSVSVTTKYNFEKLYEALQQRVDVWQPSYETACKKIGSILFMADDSELSYKYYKLVQKPDVFIFNNLIAIHPDSFSIAESTLDNLPETNLPLYFVYLNFTCAFFEKGGNNYLKTSKILTNLIKLKKQTSDEYKDKSDILFLKFYDYFSPKIKSFYDTSLESLKNQKKILLNKGKDTFLVDEKIRNLNKEYNKTLELFLSELSTVKKDTSLANRYIEIYDKNSHQQKFDILILSSILTDSK